MSTWRASVGRAFAATSLLALWQCSSGNVPGNPSGKGGSGGASISSSGRDSGGASAGFNTAGVNTAGITTNGGSSGATSDAGVAVVPITVPDTAWVDGTCSGLAGATNFETAEFCVSLDEASQTVAALKPKSVSDFDFAPSDLRSSRSGAGYMQLGDMTLRVRTDSAADWQNVTTSGSRTPVTSRPVSGNVLAAADLGPALPNIPLSVKRSWLNQGGRLVMRFTLTNSSSSAVQIGGLGFPLVFNNIISNYNLDDAHAKCSLDDPYIGRDAGYVQVTRLNGASPALLVLPDGATPFEAWDPILNPTPSSPYDPAPVFTDQTPRAGTFEGFYEWLVHSKAFADGEWSHAKPWNTATDLTLAAGQSQTYGLVFALAEKARGIESKLITYKRPTAVGIPGYIIPTDLDARLYLQYPEAVRSVVVDPVGALTLTAQSDTATGWKSYAVAGKTWGRARATVTYVDGTEQTIHYYITKPASQVVSDMGSFLTTQDWFVDPSDPFGRSPSVMTYDHELGRIVTQFQNVFVSGLSDEGGVAWLAGAMKLLGQPDAGQVGKYQQFVDGPLWGRLQYSSGPAMFGVRHSLFYYEPSSLPDGYYSANIDWKTWAAWNRPFSEQTDRSYNYPHLAALYWTMYRLARNYVGLVNNHPYDWYLNQAYETAKAITTVGQTNVAYGLMEGTVFLEILKDLQREGLTAQAADLEARMKGRADHWNTEPYPFGSELAWDSTGQEEVYAWTHYFGYTQKAEVCVDAITGYMPTIPHWGYNGCGRAFWDFLIAGKTMRQERIIHHYRSGLNAIPILTEYRDHPEDLYLLRIGYAGMMGALSNIDQDGFPSMGFHAFPDTLKWDPLSGDYGPNFFGHAYNSATYLINHPDFGWQAFGGNVKVSGSTIRVTPLDSFRQRFYVAPVGLWLTLDAGHFQEVNFDASTHVVTATLAPADAFTPFARLRIEQPAAVAGIGTYSPMASYANERDAYVVPLGTATTSLRLAAQ